MTVEDFLSTMKSGKSLIRLIVPLSISFMIIFLLLRPVKQDMLILQMQIDWKWLVVGALTYWAEVILVGVRAVVLLSTHGMRPKITVVLISNLHNFINKITPARMGELSFPYLLHRYAQISYKKALSVLIVVRLADFYTISFVAPMSLVLSCETQLWSYLNWLWLLAAVGIVSLVAIMLTKYVYPLIDYIERLLLILKSQRLSVILNLWRDLCSMFESAVRGKLLEVGVCSVVIWFLLYCTFIALGKAMNIGVPSRHFLVSGTFAILGTLLPISGVGHFGGLEAGWVLGLTLVGTTYASAIASALGVSLLTTLFALLIALASLVVLEINSRRLIMLLTAKRDHERLTN